MLKKTRLAITVSAFAISAGIAGVAVARDGRGRGGPGDNNGPPSPRELERKFDKNNDGKLDDTERAAMHAEFKARHDEQHKKVLAQFDKNRDGKLDDSERTAMMDQKVTEHFQKLDTDGNGAITLAELKAGMKLRHKHVMLGGPGGFPGHGPPGFGAPPAGGDVRILVLDDDGSDDDE
jgi:EF hand